MSLLRTRDVTVDIELISPTRAIAMLRQNKANRRIRKEMVKTYARDIRAGKWELNHQGIAFDNSGELVDGQHRLSAIVEANKPVRMMVFRGIEARDNIDVHIRRSLADTLGETPETISVAKYLGERFNNAGRKKMTVSEVEDMIHRHRDAIDFACRVLKTNKAGLKSFVIKAAVASAYYHQTPEDLERFARVLLEGFYTSPKEMAAIKLRDYLLMIRQPGHRANETDVFLRTQTAIRHFCKGNPITRIHAASGNIYPIE